MVSATGPVCVLIGPPGSGKTTVGALVAERLGVGFHDTDAAVETDQGRTISDIFIEDGEPRFRDLERTEVLRALRAERGVVAVGGGAPMDPEVQAALSGQTVVLLEVGIADAARRVGFARSRPLLAVNPRARWTAMLAERRPTYEALATHRVDTAAREPGDVADGVVASLGLADGPDGPV